MCGFVPGAGDKGFWLLGRGVSETDGKAGGEGSGGGVLYSGFQAMDFTGAACAPRTRSVVVSGFRLHRGS